MDVPWDAWQGPGREKAHGGKTGHSSKVFRSADRIVPTLASWDSLLSRPRVMGDVRFRESRVRGQ